MNIRERTTNYSLIHGTYHPFWILAKLGCHNCGSLKVSSVSKIKLIDGVSSHPFDCIDCPKLLLVYKSSFLFNKIPSPSLLYMIISRLLVINSKWLISGDQYFKQTQTLIVNLITPKYRRNCLFKECSMKSNSSKFIGFKSY